MIYPQPIPAATFQLRDFTEATLVQTWLSFRPGTRLSDTSGWPLLIVDPGQRNHYDGPDILNATLFYRGTICTGDIECHLNAESWFQHGHDRDRAYAGVILHVVQTRPTGNSPQLPHVVLSPLASREDRCMPFPDLAEILTAGAKRWQAKVASYRYSAHHIADRMIKDSIPLFATKGNAAGFFRLYEALAMKEFAGLSAQAQWETLNRLTRDLDLHWRSAGIRPAARPIRRLALWARFITRVSQLEPDNRMSIAVLFSWVKQVFPTDLAVELAGNILLPLQAARALAAGDMAGYKAATATWSHLKLSQPYGKVRREFGHRLPARELRRFPVLQGCLAFLAAHD